MSAPGRGARAAGQRGMTLLEVLIAAAVLLVAFAGFVATANTASRANAIAHRRGTAAYQRTALLERYAVTSRSAYASIPADAWIVDRCFDEASRELASNGSHSSTFTCPSGSVYRSWIRLTGTGPWTLGVYSERIVPGCRAEDRFSSGACVAADHLLTD